MRKNKVFKIILAVVFSIALSMTALFAFGCASETPTYIVTFDSNGGSLVMPQQVESGKTATNPAAPERSGYTFEGWYEDKKLETEYDFSKEVTANMTLYASWSEIETYTVMFESNGGNPVASQTIESGKKVNKPDGPTKAGYTFEYWMTTAGTEYNFDMPVSSGFTLYAYWTKVSEPETYSVTFEMQGHGTAPAAQTITEGGHATEPAPEPSETGWMFGGWYKEAACTNEFNFANETITSATKVYAKWTKLPDQPITKEEYTVTFEMQGHGVAPAAQTITEGEHANKPANPTEEGWAFGGWYKEAACTNEFDFDTETITEATKVYAKWTKVEENVPGIVETGYYIVTFVTNCDAKVPQQRVEDGKKAAKPETPVNSGKVLEGWYENENLSGSAYDFANTTVTKNLTLYANWVNDTKPYYVTFNSKGGKFETMDNQEIIQEAIASGSKAIEPTAPVKENLTFAGWYENENCEGTAYSFDTAVTADITLYAKWTEDEPTAPVTPPASDDKITATSINFNDIALTDTIEKSDGSTYQGKNLNADYALDEKGIITLKGGAWEVDANKGSITDASGSAVQANNRLKSKGVRTMEINLSEYTGKVKLQFFVRTASGKDLTRGVKLSNAEGTDLGSLTLTEDKIFTFEVTVDCGSVYTLSVITNGVNFYGINLIPVE